MSDDVITAADGGIAALDAVLRDERLSDDEKVLQIRDLVGEDRRAKWRVMTTLDKFDGDWTAEQIESEGVAPVEHLVSHGNLLMYGGASCLIECLIGNGTSTAAQTLTFFSNARAYIGVGDSTTAAVATQTDLQAATNKTRAAMDASYPSHSDGTSSGAATVTFRATYDTSTANHRWREWGIFNGSTGGRMLNRKVEDLDGGSAKTSAQTWQLTVTITIS